MRPTLKSRPCFSWVAAPAAVPEELGWHYLALPCPDDYASLPQRTLWFCRWALEEGGRGKGEGGWDYLFKCDDDTYVSIPRLLSYDLRGRDYVGAEWRPGVGYGSGGAGYFLSRRAAGLVAERLTQATGAEDLLVGQILRAAGIEFSIEPRLVPFGSIEHRPRRENDLITLHGVEADAFLAAHAETGLLRSSCHNPLCRAVGATPTFCSWQTACIHGDHKYTNVQSVARAVARQAPAVPGAP